MIMIGPIVLQNYNYYLSKEAASDRAEQIFSVLDINSDGELNEDEFIGGCLDDDDLVSLLNAGGCDPDEEYD